MSRNGDGVFKRGAMWCFRYRDHEGHYREKSTGKRKQSEAREAKHSFMENLKKHLLPTEEARWKLGQALEHWIEYRSATP